MVSADQQPVVVAAFDVDGTLTSRDCVVPFLVRIGGWSRVLRASVRHPVLLASTALGRGDRDRLKEVVVGQLVRGRNRASLDELGRRFALDAVANGCSLLTNFAVTSADIGPEHTELHAADGNTVRTRFVVNAAGLHGDELHRLMGFGGFTVRPRRGELIVFDK